MMAENVRRIVYGWPGQPEPKVGPDDIAVVFKAAENPAVTAGAEERARIVAWHRAQAVAMRAEAARTGQGWYREKCEARAECYEHAADAIERQDHAL